MTAVYCKNCAWRTWYDQAQHRGCGQLNRDGACRSYQRQFWKFWVREG